MSNFALRNEHLLQTVANHPLKAALAKCLDVAEEFSAAAEHASTNRDLSDSGRASAVQKYLRTALRDLRDARSPIEELKIKLVAKKEAVKIPPFDTTDIVGFHRRQELRAALKGLPLADRTAMLTGPNASVDFVDAALEQHQLLSGFANNPMEEKIFATVKEDRLQSLFGPQLAEIDGLETEISEASMIADTARVDIADRAGLPPPQFAKIFEAIETKTNAPWLRRDKNQAGVEQIIVVDLELNKGRPASADEIRDGKFYKDHAEYLADRAA